LHLYLLFAMLAGLAWGIGGYFEKADLRDLGIPPIAGITLRTAITLGLLLVVAGIVLIQLSHRPAAS
jgi:uncharacterized membrane protein